MAQGRWDGRDPSTPRWAAALFEQPRSTAGEHLSRVAIFHPSFKTRGGAEFLCAHQARRLASNGHDVTLVTFRFDPEVWNSELTGVDVVVVPERTWADAVFNWGGRSKLMARGRRARAALSNADVVVAHNAPCNLLLGALNLPSQTIWQCNEPPRHLHRELANPYMAGHAGRAPHSSTDFATRFWREALSEELAPRKAEKTSHSTRLDLEMTGKLDKLYAISEFSRDNARAIYGRCDEEVVYPFVRFPEGTRKSGPTAKSGLQVLVQTRLEWLKNVDSVIRGFAQYLKSDPDAVLHVVGEGEARQELTELARELMPAAACQFHGYLSNADLSRMHERCDVFALLTIDEPFGMVYPEAAARGLLIIGPDHGGPLEILEGGELGHCIDPFDPEALGEALQQLRGLTASEANRRREAADRSCRERFSEERIEEKLHAALGLEQGALLPH